LKTEEAFVDLNLLTSTRISRYPGYQEMITDLLSGDIDCYIANDVNMNFTVHSVLLLKLNYPDKPFYQYKVRAGALPANQHLLTQFNRGMDAVTMAERDSIKSKWGPHTIGYKLSWPLIGISITIALLSMLSLIVWLMNLKLKAKVLSATQSLIQEKDALRQAQNDALEQQTNIKALLDNINICIFALNDEGIITHLNRHAEKWTNNNCYSDKRTLTDCFPFLTEFELELKDALQQREAVSFYRQKICIAEDKPIIANIRLKPIVIEGDSKALVLIEDVTEASIKEDLLVQSQKLDVIHLLAGGMAHDFNNILAVISGSASLLDLQANKTDTVQSEKVKKYVANIFKATEKGVATTKSLATLSGRVSVDISEFSINSVITNVIDICKSTMDQSVTVKYQQPTEEYSIRGNQGLIEQAFLNVMINAYHAMTIMKKSVLLYGGELSISLHLIATVDILRTIPTLQRDSADHYIKICIKDDGVGFSGEQLEKAFTPFYTTKEKNVATGLGLPTVQNTIVQHQGEIHIESQENNGTEVFIYLPCSKITQKAPTHKKITSSITLPASGENAPQRILLADDNPIIIETLSAGLEDYGYEVSIATNGSELLATYRNNPDAIDVIITDLEMPVMNGDDAFYEIRKINPEAKVIMTSGFLEDERVQKVLLAGANGFVQKPCNLEKLVRKINQVFTA
jgi:nitrogen-specific signal transduction histidine kinase